MATAVDSHWPGQDDDQDDNLLDEQSSDRATTAKTTTTIGSIIITITTTTSWPDNWRDDDQPPCASGSASGSASGNLSDRVRALPRTIVTPRRSWRHWPVDRYKERGTSLRRSTDTAKRPLGMQRRTRHARLRRPW